jgi:histidine triad (HIT) family protein
MCIFCEIIEGKAPSYKIYEDKYTYAFLDIHPVTDGHVLLIPKYHEQFIEKLPEQYHKALFNTMRKLVKPIQNAFEAPASSIAINNGPNAGQIIPHVHIHIIPRPSSVGKNLFTCITRSKPKSKEYFEEICAKIKAEISLAR